jgi:hypothetical protein
MQTMAYKLTSLVAKLQTLPKDRQQLTLSALAEIVEDLYDCDDARPADELA